MIKEYNKTAIWTAERQITYHEMLCRIHTFAERLKAEGVKAGDKVVIFSENKAGWLYALYGIWEAGAVAVPVDSTSGVSDLSYILNDCKPNVVVLSEVTGSTGRQAIEKQGGECKVIEIDSAVEDGEAGDVVSAFDRADSDMAVIIYTSGTTGSPKGVMLSFENLRVNVRAVSVEVEIFKPEDMTMILLPLHHVLPLAGTAMAPFFTGGTVAICPSMSAPDLMATMQGAHVSIIVGVPRLYSMLAKGIKSKIDKSGVASMLYRMCEKVGSSKLSKLVFGSVRKKMGGRVKYFVSGGAALDPVVAQTMKTLGLDVLEGYGMTECAPMIAFTRPDDIKPGASGQPVPSVEVEIRDGEICARGRNVMLGYYNRPEETADVLDPDGWIHTGDLGYIDDNGRVVVTGRRKEIIVLSNGKNVNPTEIEHHLEAYNTYVKEAAVTDKDDQLVAIIVPQRAAVVGMSDEEVEQKIKWEVLDKYNAEAAAYKKIFSLKVFRGDLPRTKLEKLQRYKLGAILEEGEKKEEVEAESEAELNEEYAIIKKYIEEEKKCKVHPTDHIELDLAFDSLDKVGLQVFLNGSFGMQMTTDDIAAFKSVGEMAEAVAERKTKTSVEKIDWKKILREHTNLRLPQTWATGRIAVAMMKPFLKMFFKLTGKGLDKIPDGPVIIAPNHQSFIDGLFVMSFLKWRAIKNTYFYAKEQHVKRPFIKAVAATHNVIVMDMSNLKDSIQKLGEALKKKKNLIIFPEGTRTLTGKLGEFKKTFAILSKELNIPVVPVSIKGAYEAMPKGSKFPHPHRVQVEFLDPVYPRQDSSYESLTEETYKKIKKCQEEGTAA